MHLNIFFWCLSLAMGFANSTSAPRTAVTAGSISSSVMSAGVSAAAAAVATDACRCSSSACTSFSLLFFFSLRSFFALPTPSLSDRFLSFLSFFEGLASSGGAVPLPDAMVAGAEPLSNGDGGVEISCARPQFKLAAGCGCKLRATSMGPSQLFFVHDSASVLCVEAESRGFPGK